MTADDDFLRELYRRVMSATQDFFEHETFVVRHWDGMDGCWTDYTSEVSLGEALRVWARCTDEGTRAVAYEEIDYFRIFPGTSRMYWDGTEDHEMHR